MPEVYAAKLDVTPRYEAGLESNFLTLLRQWVGERWSEDSPWFQPEEPRSVGLEDGSILRWEPYNDRGSFLYEFIWRHPHVTNPDITWATQASLYRVRDQARLTIRVWNTGPEIGEPNSLLTTRPRLLLLLGDCFSTVRHEGSKLTAESRSLDEAEFPYFVRYELMDPGRQRPILVVSPPREGSFELPPDQLAREFLSLAEVVHAKTPQNTFALTDELGDKRLSCYNGAARVYLTNFRRNDNPLRHPLLLPKRLIRRDERNLLGQKLAWLGVRHFRADDEIPQLRDRRALRTDERQQILIRQIDELRTAKRIESQQDVADWIEIAQEFENAYNSLKLEKDILQERLKEADDKVRGLQYALGQRRIQQGESLEPEPQFEPNTVLEALEYAQMMFEDDLLILPSAFESAADCLYQRPGEILRALQAMTEIGRRRRKAGSIGKGLREAFREIGLDYRHGISETSSKRMREQYRFNSAEIDYECEEHLCFGSSFDPAECARIYFTSRAEGEDRFVVGHVGRHLDVISTN